jgi:hypothetical protein
MITLRSAWVKPPGFLISWSVSDVSWLWDVDFSTIRSKVLCGGVRAADMANRLKYDEVKVAGSLDDITNYKKEFDALASKNACTKAEQLAIEAKERHNSATYAESKAQEAEAEAERLDKMVKALTDDAPRELLSSCDGIPGLALVGDDITLDGVSLDGLCGAEQIRFAVQVAKRANAKTKILVVDGLERLDPESYDEFVREATSDGWQLLASKVDRGAMVVEAISADENVSEAAE